jgi:hypothetical protein
MLGYLVVPDLSCACLRQLTIFVTQDIKEITK